MSWVAEAIADAMRTSITDPLFHIVQKLDNIELSGNCSKHRLLRRALNQGESKLFMLFNHS